ncbi:MAG: biotin transporter BioY [Anaerolineae bacterium]
MQLSPRSLTLSDVLVPPSSLARDLGLVVAFSLINAAAAQVSIALPFTPVPITGQTFAVLLTGSLLGSRLGAWSLLLYLAEGAAGLPVFALGRSGLVTLLGPTAGYLIAFPVAAFAVGWLAERGWDRRVLTTALAMVVGNVVIYAGGVFWLARFVGGPAQAVALGMAPFLMGDAVKLVLAAVLLPAGWAVMNRTDDPR